MKYGQQRYVFTYVPLPEPNLCPNRQWNISHRYGNTCRGLGGETSFMAEKYKSDMVPNITATRPISISYFPDELIYSPLTGI